MSGGDSTTATWRGRGEFTTAQTAPWNLGGWAPAINVVAMAWTVFIAIVFSLPPNELVLWTMLLVALLLGIYWKVYASARFRGPSGA